MNEIEQLTAERDEALASAKRAWDEVGVVSHRRDDFRNRWTEGIRKRLADRLAVQPLVDAARAWREARTAFGATRMEQEHDVLWAATEQLEAAVDALVDALAEVEDTPQDRPRQSNETRKAEEDLVLDIIERRDETAERDRLTPRMEARRIINVIDQNRATVTPQPAPSNSQPSTVDGA